MDKNELYRMKDELLNSKAQDLEQIEDHKEYAMRANELRAMQEQQRKQDAMRAAEQSEERFRKMMEMGKEKQDIEYNNIIQEKIKKTYETEEIKKHNR